MVVVVGQETVVMVVVGQIWGGGVCCACLPVPVCVVTCILSHPSSSQLIRGSLL